MAARHLRPSSAAKARPRRAAAGSAGGIDGAAHAWSDAFSFRGSGAMTASDIETETGAAEPLSAWYRDARSARGRFARVLCLSDFERLAKARLPRPIWGYVSGAAADNRSFQANAHAFAAYAFKPRVLRDVSRRSAAASVFGRRYALPVGAAPMGLAALAAFDADRRIAAAAREAGAVAVLSGSSLTRLEAVAEVNPDVWFQAYVPGDFDRIRALLERVAAAGITTLVATVDMPVAGNRENLVRAGFSAPLRPSPRLAIDGLAKPRWLLGVFARTLAARGMPHFENSFAERGAPILSRTVERDFSRRDHLDWTHFEAIRRLWRGHLVIKGVLAGEDAARAVAAGADGVIVSNHGGRQLDGAVSPLEALTEVIEAAPGVPVMMDGGVRRGGDVLKALCLGAAYVFVGRPLLYAAAAGGSAGVRHAFSLLGQEIDRDLALLGVTRLEELGPHLLTRR